MRVESAPEWILLDTEEVRANAAADPSTEAALPVAALAFDVAFGAPVNEPAEVRLGVWQPAAGAEQATQRVGEKTIRLVVEAPREVTLAGNYPNPFGAGNGAQTTIQYALSEPSTVRLVVYDVLGREVVRLVDGRLPAGGQEVVWDASHLASGVYVARLVVDGAEGRTVRHRQMLLVK